MEDESGQGLLNLIRSLLGKKPHLNNGADLSEEIQDLVDEGQAKGLITDEESDMVHGVLDLKETKVYSIMIPRTDMSGASINATLGEIIKLVSDCGHTRIPIFRDSIDKIEGILHAKDLLKSWGENPDRAIPREILRTPYFIPRSQSVSELLKELKSRKTHLAIVTDEYGGTAGIITIEDILEEIVGEIMDEHDPEDSLLTVLDGHSVLVDARLEIENLEEHFGRKLPQGDFESVGGFIIHLLGRIPTVGEKVGFEDLEMTVKVADNRKIHKILISHQSPPDPASNIEEQH
ncbi:hemolysin family protein [Thermodesulfobacteriota bacterium]